MTIWIWSKYRALFGKFNPSILYESTFVVNYNYMELLDTTMTLWDCSMFCKGFV